jgi:hypothetical protein
MTRLRPGKKVGATLSELIVAGERSSGTEAAVSVRAPPYGKSRVTITGAMEPEAWQSSSAAFRSSVTVRWCQSKNRALVATAPWLRTAS